MNPLETEQRIYDFALYIYPIPNSWPKAEKFALTRKIKNCIFTRQGSLWEKENNAIES